MNWQRANIQAAASYLREAISRGGADGRAQAVYDGLLEVLDPGRRTARLQREAAHGRRDVATTEASVNRSERRTGRERRSVGDRRHRNAGPPAGIERRKGGDRRSGRDRRAR